MISLSREIVFLLVSSFLNSFLLSFQLRGPQHPQEGWRDRFGPRHAPVDVQRSPRGHQDLQEGIP